MIINDQRMDVRDGLMMMCMAMRRFTVPVFIIQGFIMMVVVMFTMRVQMLMIDGIMRMWHRVTGTGRP